MTNRLLSFFAAITVFSIAGYSQDLRKASTLDLISGSHEVSADSDGKLSGNEIKSWPGVNGWHYGIMSLDRALDRKARNELHNTGIKILDHIPSRFYVVAVATNANLDMINEFGIVQAQGFIPEFKWVANRASVPSRAIVSDNTLAVNITAFANISLESFAADLASVEGASVVEVNDVFDFVQLEVEQSSLSVLAELPSVYTIEWIYPEGEPENYTSRTLTRTRYLSHDNSNGIGYDGTGVSVGIQDNGTVGPHLDYHGRIQAQFSPNDEGDHGDHVTGTVGGAGNLNPWHQGQAEGTDLYIYKAWPEYNAISNMDSHYVQYDIYLTSTSYSDGCNAGYTNRTRTIDQQGYNYEKLIHVYSAGNAGGNNCGYGAGPAWGNITGGHKMGKSAITVGNLTEFYALSGSSSRGPAYDGRIKPDICAQGSGVTSSVAGNLYATYSGTSMSCPNVAGSLALLYEAFEDVHGDAPDGGLMKAIVLNTADDLGNAGPDFKHGWGRLNGRQAFQIIEGGQFMVDSLADGGGSNTHQITVPSGVHRLRVMIYWTDPAASVSASTSLINDLDLRGFSPTQDTLLPYVLDPTPNASTLDEPADYGVDHLNNMEQIELMNPEAGTYSFEVSPYYVPMGPQEYFLVYYMEDEPLVLTYPVGGEPFTPFTAENIRWDSELSGTLNIELSQDGGVSWSNLASGIPADQEYHEWTVPTLGEGDIRLRLVHDSATVESQDFSIMATPENISVVQSCPDSIILQWDPIGVATSYDVYKLGEKYMDSLGTSVSTQFVDHSSNPYSENLWYAVSADGPEAAKGKRSISVQKAPGLIGCFLGNDLHAVSVESKTSQIFPCHDSDFSIDVVVENEGVVPSSPFLASFYGPSGLIASDSFMTSLAPLTSDTFSFTSPVTLEVGSHLYYVRLEMDGDQNHWNDTAFRGFYLSEEEAIIPMWEEHFDGYNFTCSSDPNCGATECALPEGWINEKNGFLDDIDWRLYENVTPSQATGPYGDNTTPGGQGKFIYLESNGCFEQEASLISPCVDLSSSSLPILSFYYSMYGSDMGDLHVDVFDGNIWQHDVMDPISGDQGLGWNFAEVDLSQFNGMNINVRFRGITGGGERSDMALDDIAITHPPTADFEFFTQPNGQTVLFNDLSSYADSMSFDLGDGTMLMDSVPDHHDYNFAQTYTVTQFVSNAFGSDSLSLVIENLGLTALQEAGLRVFPNPVSTQLTIESMQGEIQMAELWTVDGRLVMSEHAAFGKRMVLDLGSFSPGVYLLKVTSDQVTEVPLIITR